MLAIPFAVYLIGLALVEPQRPERQPGVPQVDPVHGRRRFGEGPGGAVVGS